MSCSCYPDVLLGIRGVCRETRRFFSRMHPPCYSCERLLGEGGRRIGEHYGLLGGLARGEENAGIALSTGGLGRQRPGDLCRRGVP